MYATDFEALSFIVERGAPTTGDIGRKLGLTSGAVTGVIDRLAEPRFRRARRRSTRSAQSCHSTRGCQDRTRLRALWTDRTGIGRACRSLRSATDRYYCAIPRTSRRAGCRTRGEAGARHSLNHVKHDWRTRYTTLPFGSPASASPSQAMLVETQHRHAMASRARWLP